MPAVTDLLAGLNGSSSPLRNDDEGQKGSFNIGRFTFTPPQLDRSLRPTSTSSVMAPGEVVEDCRSTCFGLLGGCWTVHPPGGPVPSDPPDDEHRLRITARLPDVDIPGNVSWSPIGADYHVSGDLTATIDGAVRTAMFRLDAVLAGGLSVGAGGFGLSPLQFRTTGAPVGASGILDASTALGGSSVSIRGEVAPMLVPTAQLGLGSPEGRPFTILWPNVQVELSGARFAVDVAVGVDATVDGSSGRLVPSAAVALDITLLRCPGLELVGGLLADSALLDQFEQWLGDGVIRPRLSNSIGQVAIPHVLGIRVDGASVASVQGNLAAFVDLAPVPTRGVRLTPVFDGGVLQRVLVEADPAWFPGSGPYQVHWVIGDGHGSLLHQSPPVGEADLERSFWAVQLSPVDDGCITTAGIDVQATVSRSGWTRQAAAADTWFWWTPGSSGTCQ